MSRKPWDNKQKEETAVSHTIDRRRFVLSFAVLALPGAVGAAMGANDKFDLLIRGGEVLDPSQRLRGVRDIGIKNGLIEAVEAGIAPERALRVIDAKGKLVTPGLIDLHAHTYPYGSAIGIPADELIPAQGTTTAISAGDAGANNFAAFRRFIVGSTRTRLYAFVHIANIGLAGTPVPELYNIDYARTEDAARTLAENADIVIGIKVRMSENVIAKHGLEPLKRAIRACELSGAQGASPDTISSDIHVFSGNSPGMPYLTWVMSKFLNMGFSLEQVVAMATINAARAIGKIAKLGTLEVGAPGDATILDVVEGPVEFVDTRNNKRQGKVHLRPVQTVTGGIAFGRPYSAPFSAR